MDPMRAFIVTRRPIGAARLGFLILATALICASLGCSSMPRQQLTTRVASVPQAIFHEVTPAFTLDETAGLSVPLDIEVDPTGRLIVLDAEGPDLHVFDVAGNALDRWPVSGTSDLPFFRPQSLGISGLSLLLLDPSERVILRFDLRGQFRGVALDLDDASLVDRIGFFEPAGFAVDKSGQLFISDRDGHRLLVFDPAGRFVMTFGGFGAGAGQLRRPTALATDEAGLVYVADTGNGRIQLFDGFGAFVRIVDLPAPPGAAARIPSAVRPFGDGTLLVADDGGVTAAIRPDGETLFEGVTGVVNEMAVHPAGRAFLLQRDLARIVAVDPEGF